MRLTELEELMQKRPFEPFRVRMSDGRSYEIKHPEMAMLTKAFLIIGVQKQKRGFVFDHTVLCQLVHIVSIEVLNERRSAKT